MTLRECGCCGRAERDSAALLLLVEAVHIVGTQREAKLARDDDAWAKAHAVIAQAEAQARG